MSIQTTYMGLQLRSPIVVSACSLAEDINNIVQMDAAGAGAIVLYSLFEEQIRREETDHLEGMQIDTVATAEYMELIWQAKQKTTIPIIGSLNGITPQGWIRYARLMEQAGADGIEINIFFIPGDVNFSAAAVEHRYLNIVAEVKNTVKIPVAVKLSPYFSAMGNMAHRLQSEGADALVFFNRFYQPDIDINELKTVSNLQYSEANEIRLPLLWIGLLYGKLNISLAATTGVQSSIEVIKYILAGADAVMVASTLYKNGIGHIKTMNKELEGWMHTMDFDSIKSFKGIMSQRHVVDPIAYERANYINILKSNS
jgi:dihydroorotate dehydrogenase (fumarate)